MRKIKVTYLNNEVKTIYINNITDLEKLHTNKDVKVIEDITEDFKK